MEWRGTKPFATNPKVVNPAQGHIANWNNKPAVDHDNTCTFLWSAADRVNELEERLQENTQGDNDQLGRSRPDYATMSFEQLCKLPVGDLADVDCHIYMWITNRSLPKGFALLEAWGFRYITALTWVKPHFGMGNYFRGQTEHVLFGVKGSQMLKRKDVGTVFNAPRGPNGHSSKPVEFYSLVESCSPGPYLEMFSRSERKDWTAWGEGQ
jgi:N6-adenosine-specific RNA methylase IME4